MPIVPPINSRQAILRRLREITPDAALPPLPTHDEAALFADYPGDSLEAMTEAFCTRLTALSGEVHLVPDLEAARAVLVDLLGAIPAERLLVQDAPLIDAVLGDEPAFDAANVADGFDLPNVAMGNQFDVALTIADCLVARTGSVIVRNVSAGGRRLSVLPPTHIVVATVDQIVPSLGDGLALLRQTPGDWSYGVVISGPSRTADIEKILVLGAHGPKRLIVLLLDHA